MNTNFTSSIIKILTSAHRDFEEIFNTFPYKIFLGIFSVIYGAYIMLTITNNAVDPSNNLNFFQGLIYGTIGAMIGVLMVIVISFIEIYLMHLFTQMQGGILGMKNAAKIYIIAMVPGAIMLVISSLGMIIVILSAVLGRRMYSITNILFLLFIVLISIIVSIIHYYVLISGIKTVGQLDTTKAIISGCLPDIILFLIVMILGCLCILILWGVVFAAIGLS